MGEKQKEEIKDEGFELPDDVLEAAIGPWGQWQARLSFYMSLLKLPIAWFQLIILFLAPPTNHTCSSPLNQTVRTVLSCP